MTDPQQIVERIRAFMASTDETRTPELVEVAETFATLCADTNARLRRCRDYLRQGLRAEATHEADEPPALLDLVALLDLPEATDWARACGAYQLRRPAPLLIEAAQELNDAYAAAQPLRSLLEKHRKLAVLRAPLAQRIAVMRELARTDAATPFWAEDIEAFEGARLRELTIEATAASKSADRTAIIKLRDEVNSTQWSINVPADLRTILDRSELSLARKDADQEIRRLLPEMNTAYSAMDYDTTAAVLKKIRQLIADAQLAVTDDVGHQIVPVREWVTAERNRRERQIKFAAACEQLQLATAADAPTVEIERLKQAALALGDELPAELSRHVREQQHRREKATTRARRRSQAIIAAMVLACIIVLGLIVRTTLRDQKVREAYETLSPLIGNEKWDEARKVFDRLANELPSALERTEFKQLHAQMDDAAVREQARIKAAERDAREAEAHAKLKAAERAAQQKEMEVTKQKVASLAVQTDWLENEARIGRLSPTNATLSETETVVARIAQSPTVNDAIKHDADALTRRLKTLHDNAMRLASEHEAMGIVVASATSVTNLREALLAYTQKNPDSSHTSEFARAAANAPKWESVEEAAKLIATWEGKLQPQQSVFIKRSDAMTAYSTKYADSPFAATFDDYRSYLTVAQHALAIEGPWKTELHTLLDTPIFKEMRVLRTTDGKLYYVPADAKVQTNSLGTSFPAITTADVGNVKRVTLKPGLLVSEQPAESAQSKLAAALSKKLTALDETNWETFGLDVIDEILTHNEIDPVLRVMLLSRVARQAQAGTWGAGDVLVALDGLVSALNAGDIAWMNPTDIAANDARPKANAILAGLAPLKEARLLIAGKRAALFKALQFRVAGHGVLIRDGDNCTAGPLKTALAGQEAIIIATDSARPTLVTIGQPGNDGKLMLDPASLHGAPEGEMIFLIDKK